MAGAARGGLDIRVHTYVQYKIYIYMFAEMKKLQYVSCGERRDGSTHRSKFQTVKQV